MSVDRPNSGFPDLPTSMPDLNFPPGSGGPGGGPGHPGWGGPMPPQSMMNQMPMPNSSSPFSPPPINTMGGMPPQSMGGMMSGGGPPMGPGDFDPTNPHMTMAPGGVPMNGMRPHPHMGPQGGMPPHPGMQPMGPHMGGMNRVGMPQPGMGGPPMVGPMGMGLPPGHPMAGGPVGGGKIYPPNQPMVFNPSNPNAPPIYPCGICHKEVHDNDQAILCESGCNFWFHRVCTGLTESAFLMLTKDVYAEWVCDKCLATKNIPLVKMKP